MANYNLTQYCVIFFWITLPLGFINCELVPTVEAPALERDFLFGDDSLHVCYSLKGGDDFIYPNFFRG